MKSLASRGQLPAVRKEACFFLGPEVTRLLLCWSVQEMQVLLSGFVQALPFGLSMSRMGRVDHQLMVARLEEYLVGGYTLRWGG